MDVETRAVYGGEAVNRIVGDPLMITLLNALVVIGSKRNLDVPTVSKCDSSTCSASRDASALRSRRRSSRRARNTAHGRISGANCSQKNLFPPIVSDFTAAPDAFF